MPSLIFEWRGICNRTQSIPDPPEPAEEATWCGIVEGPAASRRPAAACQCRLSSCGNQSLPGRPPHNPAIRRGEVREGASVPQGVEEVKWREGRVSGRGWTSRRTHTSSAQRRTPRATRHSRSGGGGGGAGCVCMHLHACACLHACTHACTHARTRVHIRTQPLKPDSCIDHAGLLQGAGHRGGGGVGRLHQDPAGAAARHVSHVS